MLFPKNYNFGKLFQELTVSVKDIAGLFENICIDFKDFKEFSTKAKIMEKQADNIAKEIMTQLEESFITPFEREDLHRLVVQMDDIIDYTENMIHTIRIYWISRKPEFLDEFAVIFKGASESLSELIFEVFQNNREAEKIQKLVIAIHEYEGKADEVFLDAISKLFKNEKDPIEVIKWKQILEDLEEIADRYKDVSNIVVNMLIKTS